MYFKVHAIFSHSIRHKLQSSTADITVPIYRYQAYYGFPSGINEHELLLDFTQFLPSKCLLESRRYVLAMLSDSLQKILAVVVYRLSSVWKRFASEQHFFQHDHLTARDMECASVI